MLMVCLLVAFLVPPAEAQDGAEATAESPQATLDAALRAYAEGDTPTARLKLQSIIALGKGVERDILQSSLAYLGDILYAEEGPTAAAPIFTTLLDEDPDYVMDPFEHPEEVCRFVDGLRAVRPKVVEVVAPPPAPEPAPWLSLAPGGVYYFGRGDIPAGVAVAVTQGSLLAANLILLTTTANLGSFDKDDLAKDQEYQSLRLATDLSAGAFYLSLALPPAVEFSRWSATPPARASVGVTPTGLVITGQF